METSSLTAATPTQALYLEAPAPTTATSRQPLCRPSKPTLVGPDPFKVANGRAYAARALTDIEGLRNCGGLNRSALREEGPRSWRELEVRVPLGGYSEHVQARYRQVGVSTLETDRLQVFELRFTTRALGLKAPVECTLLLEVSDQLQADAVLSAAIQKHVKAIKSAGLEKLQEVPVEYHVGNDQEFKEGFSGGRFKRLEGADLVNVGNRAGGEKIQEDGRGNLTILLGSGKVIETTKTRLARARKLAEKITFLVNDDGSHQKAGAEVVEKVAYRLASHSLEDMDRLEKDGYKVLLVNPNTKPKGGYPGGRPGAELSDDGSWNPRIRGYVRYSEKVITMPLEALDEAAGGGSDVLLHELGHVLSDLRANDGPRYEFFGFGFGSHEVRHLDGDSQVTDMFSAYAKRCGYDTSKGRGGTAKNTSAIWSSYALQGPQEYLAEGITFYQQGGEDRKQLKEKDPEFFEYLKALLDES